jgi:hypothetical protein
MCIIIIIGETVFFEPQLSLEDFAKLHLVIAPLDFANFSFTELGHYI